MNETLKQDMDENFNEIAPICFLYERDTRKSRNMSEQLRQYYLGGGSLSSEGSLEGLAHVSIKKKFL